MGFETIVQICHVIQSEFATLFLMIGISVFFASKTREKSLKISREKNLGDRIRTYDPLHPMQVRYQAALHPEKCNLDRGEPFELELTLFELFNADASALFDDFF